MGGCTITAGRSPSTANRLIVRIGVSGGQERAWIDGPAALENFEVKVIAGRASGGPFEPEWLPDDHMRAVGRCERLEMAVQVCPPTGVRTPYVPRPPIRPGGYEHAIGAP